MNMLNEIQQNIANTVMSSFNERTPNPQEILEKTIQVASIVFNYDEDINTIVKHIEATMSFTMEVGFSITEQSSNHDKNWIKRLKREDKIYSLSYENLLKAKGMPPVIVDTISESNDDVLGLLDDPLKSEAFQRRGLVIGDVQSGKTGNYLSLVTKAADAGYKFIIIIAGIHNNLRRQTQKRVDEGFVGREGLNTQNKIGVGRNNVLVSGVYPHPVSLTTQDSDFNRTLANRVRASLSNFNGPVVLVIKKNTSTLKSLYQWLIKYNENNSNGKINEPMLMIDDESDNASVNTNVIGEDPTKTNDYLRKILHLFNKGAYIGYTATPFANIFMDPDSYQNSYEDLFPKDFIYCLNSPSNYFGPQKIFLSEDDDNATPITIHKLDETEVKEYFPISHKKTLKVRGIPKSLEDATLTFLIGKAIRNLRGQSSQNCSMLINLSTFVDVQKQVKNHVHSFINTVGDELVIHGLMHNAEENTYISRLKVIYEEEFLTKSTNHEAIFDWKLVKNALVRIFDDSSKDYVRKVFVVNSKSQDALDYDEPNKNGLGLMAVAIGGFSLSRGLTIEGLMVSYFFRSTKMYDTLLQMGRWFGYRPGYEDLCRIFMTKKSYDWYRHISNASQELRDQIASMNQIKQTPKDFGLYVRSSDSGLLVTARNKSRRGEMLEMPTSFSGHLKEFDKLTKDLKVQKNNLDLFEEFWSTLNKSDMRIMIDSKQADVFQNVPTDYVLEFLHKFDLGYKKDINSILYEKVSDYLEKIKDKYPTMDVTFLTVGRKGSLNNFKEIDSAERSIRNYKKEEEFYRLNKSRVGGQEDEKYGLSKEQQVTNQKNKATHYRFQRNKPLILLYLIEPKFPDGFEDIERKEAQLSNPIPTLALSFPPGDENTKVTILANQIYNDSLFDLSEEDDFQGDDYDD